MEERGEEKAKTLAKGKRDEWSEVGIMSLLDAYESKWVLRNRAKLKGSDWEDIVHHVSARGCGTKPVKTPNQCKNKIESMKRRHRAESAVNNHPGSGSSWQFYARMDKLLKGTQCLQSKVEDGVSNGEMAGEVPGLVGDLVNDRKEANDNGPVQSRDFGRIQHCEEINVDRQDHRDDGPMMVSDNSEFNTPCNDVANAGEGIRKINVLKRKKRLDNDVAESIRMFACSISKVEQARMDMYRDSERLRVEAEIKRSEMDLKRTEIIAKTQLHIAKIFVNRIYNHHNNRSGSSSVVAAADPIVAVSTDEKNG